MILSARITSKIIDVYWLEPMVELTSHAIQFLYPSKYAYVICVHEYMPLVAVCTLYVGVLRVGYRVVGWA